MAYPRNVCMDRPLSDKRPIGPFAQVDSGFRTVLLTCDFEPTSDMDGLESLVNDVGSEFFNGEVADVRLEDTAVGGGEGIRVVYDTQINAVFKQKVDDFESRLEARIDDPVDVLEVDSELEKITIVSAKR